MDRGGVAPSRDEEAGLTSIVDALRAARESLRQPYRVPPALLVFFTLPFAYIVIAQLIREGGVAYSPEIALDRAIPLQPAWFFASGTLRQPHWKYFWFD